MKVRNCMEDLVFSRLDDVLANQEHICHCAKCRADIAALALNFLPPRYIVTRQGEAYTKTMSLEQQFTADIVIAITNAAKIVGKVPLHQNGEKNLC
ncbi:hypothetical protein P22_0153 [Propionispora sp. 2/2-37]|uniref:late competence development ComFB family protein n=1 Tax=Propionispora sp. 2/2-37 TaxID=1677858 RepID=UPI0006BB6CFA|nr:competence protein ComFB [Propionispora sp. 2/2-37]CUH94091.1 hypothetical protein P22_0153 [Propionispora sp. 2/2-37]